MSADLNASFNHLPQQRCSLDNAAGVLHLQVLLMQCMQSSVLSSANLLTSTVNLSACSNVRRIILGQESQLQYML